MTIGTLEYIHELLKADAEGKNGAYELMQEKYQEFVVQRDKEMSKIYKGHVDRAWDIYSKASSALHDFEDQDFR